MHFWLFSIITL